MTEQTLTNLDPIDAKIAALRAQQKRRRTVLRQIKRLEDKLAAAKAALERIEAEA